MKENFILMDKIKYFLYDVIDYTENIPKKYYFIRDNMLKYIDNSIYNLNFYLVNSKANKSIREKYLKETLVSLSMIDFLLEECYRFRLLGREKYLDLCNKLSEIRKLLYGLIRGEKK